MRDDPDIQIRNIQDEPCILTANSTDEVGNLLQCEF